MTSPLRLTGQTALVTGGARRVGAAIVRALHAEGASVMIHCHRSMAEAKGWRRHCGQCAPAVRR